MTIITNPAELLEFLDYDTNSPEAAENVVKLCEAIYDYAQQPCEELLNGMHEETRDCVFSIVSKLGSKITLEFDPRESPGCIKFYKLMLSPAGGLDKDTADPYTWDLWDDETDYSDPHVEVDTTPPDPDSHLFALGKLGYLELQPDVVEAFRI